MNRTDTSAREEYVRRNRNGSEEAAISEAKKVLEEVIERWNATDREGWAALYTDDVVYEAPGGARISGLKDLKEQYFDALVTAAPDRGSSDVVLVAEGDTVVEQARYTGTHTGTWRNPNGVEIPATGKTVDFPFRGGLPGDRRQDQLDPHLLRPDRSLDAARTHAGSNVELIVRSCAAGRRSRRVMAFRPPPRHFSSCP